MNLMYRRVLAAAVATLLASPATLIAEEDDGAPHLGVFNDNGKIGVEFEIDPQAISGSTVTLFASDFDVSTGHLTRPLAGIFLNDDLGFVSEELPSGSSIVLNVQAIDTAFASLFGAIALQSGGDTVVLGSSFDTHPFWILENLDANFEGFAEATFFLSDAGTTGLTNSDPFTIRISTQPQDALIPEPASLALLGAGAMLMGLRRRRR